MYNTNIELFSTLSSATTQVANYTNIMMSVANKFQIREESDVITLNVDGKAK